MCLSLVVYPTFFVNCFSGLVSSVGSLDGRTNIKDKTIKLIVSWLPFKLLVESFHGHVSITIVYYMS